MVTRPAQDLVSAALDTESEGAAWRWPCSHLQAAGRQGCAHRRSTEAKQTKQNRLKQEGISLRRNCSAQTE